MVTKVENIINPQVMGDMIEAKIPALLRFTPYAKIDTSLQGVPGDTKTVPAWEYIGDAVDFDPETGEEIETTKLTASTATFTIKCAAKSVGLYQTAINSGMGNPIGQTETQLAKAIAGKVDNDVLAAALTSKNVSGDGSTKISYAGIVDAVGAFDEEVMTEKVIFVAPEQVTTLRKDSEFISADKYNNNVMMTGEIGMIAGARVVPSKKIVAVSGIFTCPVIKLEPADRATEFGEDELAAITIFLKKDTQVDPEWFPKKQRHDITAAKYYGVALTNEAKVVLAKFKK